MNQDYSTCCQKKETVNFVVNYVFIKPQMYLPQPQSSTSKKQKKYVRSRDTSFKPLTRPFLGFVLNPKSNFFTLICTAIWILFSLAVGQTWWQPLVFSAPVFVPLLLILRHFENK
ncbi:MAG: hypothetical protein IJZ27_01265 [Treponema sp.]|nr:hypothetical protein [Treponema sp.]